MWELFQHGMLPTRQGRVPPYTETKNNALLLRAEALNEPAIFVLALRDFIRAQAHACWCQSTEEILFNDEEWQSHLKQSVNFLWRCENVFHETLSQNCVRDRLMGQAAEFVIGKWTRSMIESINTYSAAKLSMPIWTGQEPKIDLGGGYFQQPLQGTNSILFRQNEREKIRVGEQDIMVKTKSNNAYFIDVSTSSHAVDQKLKNGTTPEKSFLMFRQKMRELFSSSGKKEGFKNVAKIHVICSTKPTYVGECLVKEEGRDSVFKLVIPGYAASRTICEKLLQDLQSTNALKLNDEKTFDLRSNP